MSSETEVHLSIAAYLRDLVRKVVAQVNREKEEKRQKWADCDCGL